MPIDRRPISVRVLTPADESEPDLLKKQFPRAGISACLARLAGDHTLVEQRWEKAMDTAFAWIEIKNLLDRQFVEIERAVAAGEKQKALSELKKSREKLQNVLNYLA
jgi:hypothetical protein